MDNETQVPVAANSPTGPSRIEAVALLINTAGAVLVVVLAMMAVFGICVLLVGEIDSSDRGSVVSSAFTVLGTIVGAYTGFKIGSIGRDGAERARNVESAKVEALTARVDKDEWNTAMDEVPKRLKEWGSSGSSGWGSSGWGR